MDASEVKRELARRELARRQLSFFIKYNFENYRENWHHTQIIEKLEAVERGEIKRLIILMPPRHGKSEIASIQFPAWFLGRNPTKSIIASSYSADLAVDFGRKARNLVRSREFANVFGEIGLAEDTTSAGRWNTNKGGEYTAVGVGGSITGRGADVFLIDDPVKNREEAESPVVRESIWGWYRSTARTRLSPNGAIVVIQTRWHDDDLSGRLMAEGGWDILELPAIATRDEEFRKRGEPLWPDQYDLANLEATKKDVGSYEWSALFQQSPLDSENQVFKPQWFQKVRLADVLEKHTRRFCTLDPAPGKSEHSDFIGITVNFVDEKNRWHFLSWRVKFDPPSLIELMFKLYREYRIESFGIEQGTYKDVLKPFLDLEMKKRNTYFTVVELKHEQTNKHLRIRGLIPRYEAGMISHVECYCDDLEEELVRFPKAKHDDVSDSAAYQTQIADAPDGMVESLERELDRRDMAQEAAQDYGLAA